jgi:hypothetical protein
VSLSCVLRVGRCALLLACAAYDFSAWSGESKRALGGSHALCLANRRVLAESFVSLFSNAAVRFLESCSLMAVRTIARLSAPLATFKRCCVFIRVSLWSSLLQSGFAASAGLTEGLASPRIVRSVVQTDTNLPTLTVRETIAFCVNLR